MSNCYTVGSENPVQSCWKFNEPGIYYLGSGTTTQYELTVVAVGGGGGTSAGGGGGSGFVAFTTTTVSTSQFVVRVGGPGEPSSVETFEGQTIIIAQPGLVSPPEGYDGGPGYSGGGGGFAGDDGGDGGEDGGDGDPAIRNGCGVGGAGSHFKISSVPISSFLLTPGRGGKGNPGQLRGGMGGGGGGVMVDGLGPHQSEYNGEGYGGGAGGGYQGPPAGPGLVLIEIISSSP